MANTYITETLSGATFYDATTKTTTTLSGTWLAEYDANGNLINIYNPGFTVTPASGSAITWNAGTVTPTTTSPYQIHATGSSNTAAYSKLYVDYAGETPTSLIGGTTAGTTAGTSTSVYNAATGNTDFLQNTGTVTGSADTAVTTTINGAVFADGSTMTGTWTAIYDSSGNLQAVENATFTVTNSAGASTTFTGAGTLPYANTASGSSYEIRFGTTSTGNSGPFTALYVDWKTENPSSFYEGSPSLYTSVEEISSTATSSPVRLASDGSSGVGSTPVITGLPASENGSDNAALTPFSGVTVTDSDTSTSATITLNFNGIASDADGVLSGTGLTKTGTGTYTLAATTPGNLTAELQALSFKPTSGQVAVGSTVATRIDLAINDTDGSASVSTNLTVTAVCFLRGTMIMTPGGEVAVEDLVAGDVVTVITSGKQFERPIKWVGGGSIDAVRFGSCVEAFPVRIRKDAFADGSPARDLLVTPEHCIFTDAGLTPVRMLVNGCSIFVDRTVPCYDFHHIELEEHGILLSDGLATESYLDTGNRDLFFNQATKVAARKDLSIAAPLAVCRDIVEPIWNRLANRAGNLGLEKSQTVANVTDHPNLRLLLDTGVEVAAASSDEQHHIFHVPHDSRPVRLLSRASIPAEMIGPFVDDRRRLGVAVKEMVWWDGLVNTTVPFTHPALDGWHKAEGLVRWTNGNAALDLPRAENDCILDLELAGTTTYFLNIADVQ